ncbi:lipopolysaccharide assembly protein b [Anaeramoeba ignava]|uniref:Lipopolysaccharide assembly protein b n=1 Tax=Anaeramoeba ignava TaxID=1746090 RepID=A0A9Q0R4R6_ANAIG|nr:lipopolysaccharide assembly protein b [Anaeramoeba ignava]
MNEETIIPYSIPKEQNTLMIQSYLSFGILLYKQKKYEKAIQFFQKAIKFAKNSTEAVNPLFHLAVIYYKQRKYEKAIQHFFNLLNLDETFYKSYFYLGLIFAEKKQYDIAIEYLKKALLIEPNCEEIHYFLGTIYYHLDKSYLTKAMAQFKFVARNSQNQKHRFISSHILGDIYFREKNYQLAISFLSIAISISIENENENENPFLLLKFALCLFYDKQFKKSVKMFQKYIEKTKDVDFQIYYNLAVALKKIHQFKESEKYFKLVLSQNKLVYECNYHLSEICFDQEKYDKASKYLTKVLEINQESIPGLFLLGLNFNRMNSLEQSSRCFNKILKINPNFIDARFQLGLISKRKSQVIEALQIFHEIVKKDPKFVDAYICIGNFYNLQTRFQKARQNIMRLIQNSPSPLHDCKYIIKSKYFGISPALFAFKQQIGAGPISIIFKEKIDNQEYFVKRIEIEKLLMFLNEKQDIHNQLADIFSVMQVIEKDNLVFYEGYYFKGPFLFLTMKNFPEGSLQDYVIQNHEIPENIQIKLASKIAVSLRSLHSSETCHKNFKPTNILIQSNAEKIFICDFEIPQFINNEKYLLEMSPNFSPPEVFLHQEYSKDSDIYSLGCILFYLGTRKLPFFGSTSDQISNYLLSENKFPVLPNDHPFYSIVNKCCVLNRKERPSLNQIISDLDGILVQRGLI